MPYQNFHLHQRREDALHLRSMKRSSVSYSHEWAIGRSLWSHNHSTDKVMVIKFPVSQNCPHPFPASDQPFFIIYSCTWTQCWVRALQRYTLQIASGLTNNIKDRPYSCCILRQWELHEVSDTGMLSEIHVNCDLKYRSTMADPELAKGLSNCRMSRCDFKTSSIFIDSAIISDLIADTYVRMSIQKNIITSLR